MNELDWRIIRELMALRARFKELMERALLPEAAAMQGGARSFECAVDVWESDTEVVVEAEIPGATSADVEVRLEGDTLLLSGELPAGVDENGTFMRIERYRGPFRRAVPLPAEVTGTPAATLRSGVLRVRLPKRLPRRRRIVVEQEAT